jgi:hypothetical protein
MVKIFIVVLVCFGASYLITDFWPEASKQTAFHIRTYQVDWLMVGVALSGVVAWKYKGK